MIRCVFSFLFPLLKFFLKMFHNPCRWQLISTACLVKIYFSQSRSTELLKLLFLWVFYCQLYKKVSNLILQCPVVFRHQMAASKIPDVYSRQFADICKLKNRVINSKNSPAIKLLMCMNIHYLIHQLLCHYDFYQEISVPISVAFKISFKILQLMQGVFIRFFGLDRAKSTIVVYSVPRN